MANITEYLQNILNSIFGKDVRDSIHDGIDAINKEVIDNTTLSRETKTRQDLLENKYDEQIKNIASSEPQSPEIVDARGGFDTLGSVIKQKIYHFENVEQMKNCTLLGIGDVCRTLGYYEKGDGGGANYYITLDESENSYQIVLDNGLFATLLIKDSVNIKQFGAYGNGTSHMLSTLFDTLEDAQKVYKNINSLSIEADTIALQTAINYYKGVIFIPKGTFLINKIIKNTERIVLRGVNKHTTTLKYVIEEDADTSIILLSANTSRNIIENINFIGPYTSQDISTYNEYKIYGINLNGTSYNTIRNCRFYQMKYGINMSQSWVNNIEDCYFGRCYVGINSATSSNVNAIYIKNCQIEYNDYGVYLGEGRNQSLYSCDIENNRTMGVQKVNEGSIEIINTYFEDKIKIFWGQTYTSTVLIMGCTFFQGANAGYTFIEFNGNTNYTKVTVIDCMFKNMSNDQETYSVPAIKQSNNSHTVHPTLINNSTYNMLEFEPVYFRGVHINNGEIHSYLTRSFGSSYINASAGGSKNLNIGDPTGYRINLSASGEFTINLPTVENPYINHEFDFLVPGNNNPANESVITIAGQNNVQVYGEDKTITKNDMNKLIRCIYIGYFNNRHNWQVIK